LGGRVIGYNDLVRHLKRDQPVYGVEFAFTGSKPDQMRMENLAAHYVREIRGVQRSGPYHLLGYSFGGLMAFEIARQLHDAAESVAFLGMLDTWQTGHLRSLEGQQGIRQKLISRVELRILHAKSLFGSGDPLALKDRLRERILRFWNDLTGLGLRTLYSACGAAGFGVPQFLQRAQDINWYAVARYTARRYPGSITLFRAEEGIGAVDARYGDELGWGGLAEQGIEVHKIPGSHLDLMKEPNVRIVAQELSACLERCRQDGSGTGREVGASPADNIPSLGEAENAPGLLFT
jgi:thioesterase domain-containing protein